MIQASEAIEQARKLKGKSYEELDCINLIKRVIRTAPGGEKSYTTAGTNTLWNSMEAASKYRDLTARQEGIAGARPGMLAFMGVDTGDVNHVGLVTESGTVIHSSKSRGEVVETELTAKAGWDGLGKHRLIGVQDEAEAAAENESEEGVLYIVCAKGGLRMRKKPDTRGKYMQMLPDGAKITRLETRSGWFKTTYNGYTGWVSAEYCCKATGNELRRRNKKRRRKSVSNAHKEDVLTRFFEREACRMGIDTNWKCGVNPFFSWVMRKMILSSMPCLAQEARHGWKCEKLQKSEKISKEHFHD